MERVIFKKNPLTEVILQFRFPTILSINNNEPADFQEHIRNEYPIYRLNTENQNEIQFVANNNMVIPTVVNNQQNKNYEFISKDGQYKINLTSSFIAISTLNYTRWEEFITKFKEALTSFIEIYNPSFFERIGLRYIDNISKKELGLENSGWKDLIKENWLGPLTLTNEKCVSIMNLNTELMIDKLTNLKIQSGIGNRNNNEEVFIVDTDFSQTRIISESEYKEVLTNLHNHSKFFIDQMITQKLYDAMEPETIYD